MRTVCLPEDVAREESPFIARLRDDKGVTLATVMAVASIMFMLSTMLIILAGSLTTNARSQEGRTKALHAADAGLNAYLFELRRNPTYFVGSTTIGPTTLGDTIWTVTATPPVGSAPLLLTATGSVPSLNTVRVVKATVRFPTYADYMFLADADINIGSDAVIDGKVRTNGNLVNSGTITGESYAYGTITGAGSFGGTKHPNQAKVNFASVSTDMSAMKTVAIAASSYFASATGQVGYQVLLQGSNAQIRKVTAVNSSTGALTTAAIKTIAIPSSGVIFFDQDVWLEGNYGAMVTVASSKNIYIPNNLVPTTSGALFTCGVVANQSVIVPTWYSAMPSVMNIEAALLAQTGTVYGDLKTGYKKSKITILGSMAYSDYGYFAQYSGNTVTAGFNDREYTYAPRLDINPPPFYPQLRDGSLKISTWVEQ